MGRTTFLTTLHCHYYLSLLMLLCYVNIYHKNFLYGGQLKVIVSYCIVCLCVRYQLSVLIWLGLQVRRQTLPTTISKKLYLSSFPIVYGFCFTNFRVCTI